jgi:hypothetical protein
MNIEQPTSNIRHPMIRPARARIGCSMFDVGCWMFLLLTFPALTSFAQTASNALPDLAPAYGELPPTFWEQHQTAITIASFAFLAFIFLFVMTRLRPESPKILSPETVARQALAKLQGQPEDGDFLSEVSQILRRYVAAAFGLPAAEMTTAEFCTALAASGKIGVELAQNISSFLRDCDERKFSSSNAVAPFPAAKRALALVEQAEKHLSSVGRASSRAGAESDGSSVASPHQPPVQ